MKLYKRNSDNAVFCDGYLPNSNPLEESYIELYNFNNLAQKNAELAFLVVELNTKYDRLIELIKTSKINDELLAGLL